MINYTQNIESNSVLKKNNLVSKQYLHLGSYGFAKGQKTVLKCLKTFIFP